MSQTLREQNETKLDVFRTFAGQGKVLVMCDSTAFGVRVPEWLKEQHGKRLSLRFGYRNGGITSDVQGLSETLSFKGVPQRVSIPWSAVYCMLSENGTSWIDPNNAEMMLEAAPEASEKVEKKEEPAPRPRPALRLVPNPDPEP